MLIFNLTRYRFTAALLSGAFLVLAANQAYAQCDPTSYGANPSDNAPDDWAIQQCLNQGGTTVLSVYGSPG